MDFARELTGRLAIPLETRDSSRGFSAITEDVLSGTFSGYLGCDYFEADFFGVATAFGSFGLFLVPGLRPRFFFSGTGAFGSAGSSSF